MNRIIQPAFKILNHHFKTTSRYMNAKKDAT
ncbi:hypothetical protein predicted by Glimmer/Critica [Lactiplantibacillus plantarum]|nr:hypothetical protein predicted by Glimmer/Critica [Lactiplantibacillus plantarum]